MKSLSMQLVSVDVEASIRKLKQRALVSVDVEASIRKLKQTSLQLEMSCYYHRQA